MEDLVPGQFLVTGIPNYAIKGLTLTLALVLTPMLTLAPILALSQWST